MTLHFTKVAVCGATGNLGVPTTQAIVAKGFKVTVLTRNIESAKKKLNLPGVEYVVADYKDKKSMVAAFKGIEVVVCTFGFQAIGDQFLMIEAAKEAKVTRFYPCEFGTDNRKVEPGANVVVDLKLKVVEAVKASGMEWTGMINGMYMEWILTTYVKKEEKKIEIVGSKDVKLTFTPLKAIGEFVAESINNPISKNDYVTVVGETMTFGEMVDVIEKETGIKYTTIYTPTSQLKAKIDGNPNKWATVMEQYDVICGTGGYCLKANQNKEFPSVKPQTLAELIKLQK